MRTIAGGLAAHLATRRTKLSRCVRFDLREGVSIGVTDHNTDLTVNLGDGALTYSAGTGVLPSAVVLSLGLDADNFEVRGPIAALVTEPALLGGRFARARARLFDVRWDATAQFMRIMAGKVAAANAEAGQFVIEVRSASDAFNQTIGRVLSPLCSLDFGHGQCQAVPLTFAATVTAVTDDLRFTVAWSAGVPTAAQIRNGLVTFATGALAGTQPIEVFNLAGAVIELYQPAVEAPHVGDTLSVTQGCDKTRTACKGFGQILNMAGFPDMTGSDQYLKFPNPGA